MHAVGKHATPRGATFVCFTALGGGSARYRILAEACVYGDVVCATRTMRVDRALPSWTGWRGAAIRFARNVSNSTSALLAAVAPPPAERALARRLAAHPVQREERLDGYGVPLCAPRGHCARPGGQIEFY